MRILLLLLVQQAGAAIELYITPTQRAFRGSNVDLSCTFSVDGPSPYFVIKWYFKRKEIVTYDNGGLSLQPRMSFNGQAVRKGEASLHISDLTIFDDGTFTCSVMHNTEKKEKDTQLQIMASPKVMITNTVLTENKASTMTCTATEFYPPDIKITWLRDNQLLQNSEMGEITFSDDRLFSVKGSVNITPTDDDREKIFSCRVQHASLPEPIRKDFQPVIQKDRNIGVSISISISAIILCLIIAAVLGIVFYKRRQSARQTQTVHIQQPEINGVNEVDQCSTEEPLHPSPEDDYHVTDYHDQHPTTEELSFDDLENFVFISLSDLHHDP